MENKKIIVSKLPFSPTEFIDSFKNIIHESNQLSKINTKIEDEYLNHLTDKINSINSSNLSYKHKLIQLIDLKSNLEVEKIKTKFGDRKKSIENKGISLVLVEINKLKEFIQINPEIDLHKKTEENKINSVKNNPSLIRINDDSKIQQKSTFLKETNESEINPSLIRINDDSTNQQKSTFSKETDESEINPSLIRINDDTTIQQKSTFSKETDESEINPSLIRINLAESELTKSSSKKSKVRYKKIKPTYSVDDIEKLFSKLYLNINETNQKPFLSKEDVEHLLAQTIEGYSSEEVEHRMFKANFNSKQRGLFYAFIYSFYTANLQGSADEKMIYAKFIQENFKGFGNKPLDLIYKRIRGLSGNQKTHPLIN
jgi:hypothetical protein